MQWIFKTKKNRGGEEVDNCYDNETEVTGKDKRCTNYCRNRNKTSKIKRRRRRKNQKKKEEEIRFCWHNEDACDHIKEIFFNV